MNPPQPLDQLLKSQQVWRASSIDRRVQPGIPSGYAVLDSYLPGRGWPDRGLAEILNDRPGVGEFQLIAPALAHLSQQANRWLAFIAPPYVPYAPALVMAGINLAKVLVIEPGSPADLMWVLEKTLASESCSAVLAWPETLGGKQLRRLQLASKEGQCLGILHRPTRVASQSSPAELRLQLIPMQTSPLSPDRHLKVQILKRKGGWATDPFALALKDNLNMFSPDFSELLVHNKAPAPGLSFIEPGARRIDHVLQ